VKERSVFLKGVKLFAKCGVYREERELGVQLLVDLEVFSDSFVDYQELYSLLKDSATKEFTYLEDLHDWLIEQIINKWNPKEVIIKTVKHSVPFQHSFEGAGVVTRWKRGR
jgi:dihydroneopterin aldolase